MSLLSYQLQLKRYQRELGLDYRTFNALDVKHSDINLLKQLQLLNPIVSASASTAPPAGNTGFWGYFEIYNETAVGSVPKHFHATFEINDVNIEGPIQINSGASHIFTIPIENRAALPTSIFKLKFTCQSGVTDVEPNGMDGFDIVGFTNNSLRAENTMSMMINDPNFIEEGFLRVDFTITGT